MTSLPYPSLRVRFHIGDVGDEVIAVVDTGFDGHLAISEDLTGLLPPPAYLHRVRTASGQVVWAPVYIGTIELTDQPGPQIGPIIALGEEYLLGLGMLNSFKITLDHGERIFIDT